MSTISVLCKRARDEDEQLSYKKTKIESMLFIAHCDQALVYREAFSIKVLNPFIKLFNYSLTKPDYWFVYHSEDNSDLVLDLLLDLVKEESVDLLGNTPVRLDINKANVLFFIDTLTTSGYRSLMASVDEYRHFVVLVMKMSVKIHISPKKDPKNVLTYTLNNGDLFFFNYSSFDYDYRIDNDLNQEGYVILFKKE